MTRFGSRTASRTPRRSWPPTSRRWSKNRSSTVDTTKAEKDAIYSQFEAGMRGFVERSRQNHVVPIITLCYTRNDFTAVEYEYTRRMNLLINSWDVSSVNFLGAVDDGTGKWAKGFWHDALHPNAAGHAELVRTFVPTLFEAIERGKPAPKRMTTTGFARVAGGTPAIWYTPDDSMHPFAFGVTLRAHGDGSVALINGSALSLASEVKREERGGGRGALEFEASTLTTATPFTATIGISQGAWTSGAGHVEMGGLWLEPRFQTESIRRHGSDLSAS